MLQTGPFLTESNEEDFLHLEKTLFSPDDGFPLPYRAELASVEYPGFCSSQYPLPWSFVGSFSGFSGVPDAHLSASQAIVGSSSQESAAMLASPASSRSPSPLPEIRSFESPMVAPMRDPHFLSQITPHQEKTPPQIMFFEGSGVESTPKSKQKKTSNARRRLGEKSQHQGKRQNKSYSYKQILANQKAELAQLQEAEEAILEPAAKKTLETRIEALQEEIVKVEARLEKNRLSAKSSRLRKQAQFEFLADQIKALEAKNAELQAANAKLKSKETKLSQMKKALEEKNAALQVTNAELRSREAQLLPTKALEAKNAELQATNAELKSREAKLSAMFQAVTSMSSADIQKLLGTPGARTGQGTTLLYNFRKSASTTVEYCHPVVTSEKEIAKIKPTV